jgi:hypothetical protein
MSIIDLLNSVLKKLCNFQHKILNYYIKNLTRRNMKTYGLHYSKQPKIFSRLEIKNWFICLKIAGYCFISGAGIYRSYYHRGKPNFTLLIIYFIM